MCNDKKLFIDIRHLDTPQQVTLGDGTPLKGLAEGTVKLDMILPDGSTQKCKLENVLYVPKVSYSLSVSKASEAGKTTKFDNQEKKVIAVATKHGNLYYLEYCRKGESVHATEKSNEMLWHRIYGHVGEQNLKSLANGKLVERFDYNSSRDLESCIGGKQHQSPINSSERQTGDLLELVHSDVCEKSATS